jgi:hypothetical protein
MDQLIRCKNCDAIIMKTPFDQYPEYELSPEGSFENFLIIEKDDFQDFLILHHGHQLENLKIIEDSFVSERAYSEPVKTSFFKATNGKDKFVVKKFREKIDEPLKYQLISGDYSLRCKTIGVQEEEISKQLIREVKPPLSQTQIAAFLKLYRHVAEDIDLRELDRVPEESPHPLEIYYKIDDLHLMYLLRNCRNIFKGPQYSAMEEFIHRHKEDGVLLLKATYKIQLTEIAKPEKRAMAVSLPAKKEKMVDKK